MIVRQLSTAVLIQHGYRHHQSQRCEQHRELVDDQDQPEIRRRWTRARQPMTSPKLCALLLVCRFSW
jgi:hypothetical protein